MCRILTALVACAIFQHALLTLRDKDPQCRYRLHYPPTSWHTAYDVCGRENKTLARVSSLIELQFIEFVLINVGHFIDDPDKPFEHVTNGIWIEGFLRSSNNESMQQNCKSFDSDISIQVTKTQENVDIFCLYYNLTDGVLYTDICENPKAFLCESSTNDLEECFISSRVEILKNAQPFFIATESTKNVLNNDQCRDECLNDPKCFAYTVNVATCTLGRYKKENNRNLIERGIPDILEHKAIFIYIDVNKSPYPPPVPKAFDAWCPEITEEVIQEKIDNIQKNLTVNKKETNQYIRTLTSAPDERQSAKNIGIVGVTVISVVIGLVILSDCTNVISAIQNKCKGDHIS
uniref:Uncharacterized protein LOC111115536 n=1 Tax=Crassostrea virginica TaxID=6565 RepID=A0A8B8C2V8_CRAVI|nr:uncharacterized protein LOC111115536 [Crassostrea virginica]